MKISTKGRYALTIMLDIAKNYESGEFTSLSDIAEMENISLKYLEKIMVNLKNADFFIVTKGKNGGYKLKKSPGEYSIGEIIRAAEEELDIVSCVSDKCPKKHKCDTYPIWKGLSDEINEYLNNKNLGEYL